STASAARRRIASGPGSSGKPWPRFTAPDALASADISSKMVVGRREKIRLAMTASLAKDRRASPSREASVMEIVEFRPEHAAAFRELNVAWISKYFALEPADLKPLDDPQGYILDRGGKVFMAFHDDRAVGCVALLKMADGGYEVAKMT